MTTTIANDLKIHSYKDNKEIEKWCNENLVIRNPDYLSALRMGRYVGNIPKHIYLFERSGDTLILPFGVLKRIWHLIKDSPITLEFGATQLHQMTGDIKLYPYQQEAMDKLLEAKNGILQAPCGSGKTQIGLQLINKIGLKALWITHTLDLINQAKNRADQYFEADIGTISGGNVNIGRDITFATVQTLSTIDLTKYRNEWNVIIVDECHKVAGSPTRIMQFYKVLSNLSARYKYGLSATLSRADNMIESTFAMLGNIVFEISESSVGDKTIRAEHIKFPLYTIPTEAYLDTDGTMIYNKLIDFLCRDAKRNEFIAAEIYRQNNYGLVLSHRVEHCYTLRQLVGYGEVLTGETSKAERERILGAARRGDVRLVFSTYSLAKEGLDIPILDRLFMVSPQKDYTIVKQSAGRIERNIEGKKTPKIIDFVDVNIGYCVKAYQKRRKILQK